jgi:hypothetical protein
MSWEEMGENAQAAWEVLGWTEDVWDDDDADPPESDGLYWVDLNGYQKDAATNLGYVPETWDENYMRAVDSDGSAVGSDSEEGQEAPKTRSVKMKPKKSGCC